MFSVLASIDWHVVLVPCLLLVPDWMHDKTHEAGRSDEEEFEGLSKDGLPGNRLAPQDIVKI